MVKVANKAPANAGSDYLVYRGDGPWYTSNPKGEHKLQTAQSGFGSYKMVPLRTMPQVFNEAVKKYANKPALRTENAPPLTKGQEPPEALALGKWKTWTYREYKDDVKKFAKAAIAIGMNRHESVNIFGFNTPQWAIAMYGAIFAGGKVAGIYPSDTADSLKYKSDHSNGAIAVVESEEHLEKFLSVANDLPLLKAIVCWGCKPGPDVKTKDGRKIRTFSFKKFLKFGETQKSEGLKSRVKKIRPGHCCALVYTSGTTGRPKAVMLCHDSINYCAEAVFSQVLKSPKKESGERVLSYLPLSHVAGMMLDLILPLVVTGGENYNGYITTHFARSYDLKTGTLVNRLQAVRPTMFLGVPRVYEKIMEKLKAVGATTKGVKKILANFSKKRGALFTQTRQLGGKGKTPKAMPLANFVLGKIKAKLGLDKCKFMLSGAAPLSVDVLNYFGSLGININEAYGMSETSGVVTFSNNDCHLWGSVGYEIPGTEVRVLRKEKEAKATDDIFKPSEKEQGELCFRGRQIMMGYMANERLGKDHVVEIDQKNAEAIDKNGFLRSGDKGTRDTNGMIKITGRYKELIITAGGENIAPVPIEDEIKRLCPAVSNAVMIGNKRKFNVVLITLKTVGATGELPGTNKLDYASLQLSSAKLLSEAMKNKTVIKKVTDAITATNKNINVVPSNAAKIQKFTILPRDFSVMTGEFTATLKLKRSVVEDQFAPIIDQMFKADEVYVNYNSAPTKNLDMGKQYLPPVERNMSLKMDKVESEAIEELEEAEKSAA